MGVTTDFIGYVDIDPGLNDDEQAYLAAFTKSRRCVRPGGPYAVPGNPAAERAHEKSPAEIERQDEAERASITDYNTTAEGQPSLWCDWEVCWSGCCLTFSGVEKFYGSTLWLGFLIDHFLRPGAHAASSGLSYFEGFTFDHRLDGLIASCRRSDKEMSLIRVTDNVVTEELLRTGDRRLEEREQLAYEAFKDAEAASYGGYRKRKQPVRRRGTVS
jgi:hypothetical protein